MQQRGAKMVKVAIVAVQDCWDYPVTQSSCYGFAVSRVLLGSCGRL
jgi:hypothetical protein